MRWKSLAVAAVAALAVAGTAAAQAPQPFKQLPINNPNYVKPFPPLRIVGNLYYVGTYDLAVYLIPTREGSILINTGINDSVPATASAATAATASDFQRMFSSPWFIAPRVRATACSS